MVAFMIQPVSGECCVDPCSRSGPCEPCGTCDCDPDQAQVEAELTLGGGAPIAFGTFTWSGFPNCRYDADSPPLGYTNILIFLSDSTDKWTVTFTSGGAGQVYTVASTGCGAGPAATYVDAADPSNEIVVANYP